MNFPSPGAFSYDAAKPTYYSEFYAWSLHQHQYMLSMAGAKIEFDNVSEYDKIQNVTDFSSKLVLWASAALDIHASYQRGETSELPSLPSLPDGLTDILTYLATLTFGGKVALVIKIGLPILQKFLQVKESLRETDPVRVLAKGLLKSNWWDITGITQKSWLEEINNNILKLQDALSGNDEKGVAVVLRQALLRDGDDGAVLNLIDLMEAIFVGEDCTGNKLAFIDAVKIALMRCNNDGVFETVQDSIDSIRDVLAAVSIFIETEKATRIRMGCIEGNEQPVQ